MAAIANTFVASSAKVNRETLSDIISMITPQDTPIYSALSHPKIDGIHPEWAQDALRAPAANAQLEGDEFTFNAITPAVRVGNWTQILRASAIISETQEAVVNAGQTEKRRKVKLKAGVELRKDVELSIISNVASVAGSTRVSGGLPSWLTTNVSRGAAGANGGFSSGTGLTVAATNGTQRAFTQALLDTTMAAVYAAGGNVDKVVMSPYVKSVFVTFMSNANVAPFRVDISAKGKGQVIVSNVEGYLGPYGMVSIEMDRVMALNATSARNVFLIDTDMLEWDWLRPMAEVKGVAKTGDADKLVIIGEGCLRVENEAGLGVIADVFGLTAAS